jgi:hypothetical protein
MSAARYEDYVGSTLSESRPEVTTNTACSHDYNSHKTSLIMSRQAVAVIALSTRMIKR